MSVRAICLQEGGGLVAKLLSTVPLGRWEGTNVGSLVADGVFDDSLYSHYHIIGRFRPASNGQSFYAVLRDGTPADVPGGLKTGGAYGRLDASGGGSSSNNTYLSTGNTSAIGIMSIEMRLQFGSGVKAAFSNNQVQSGAGGDFSTAYNGYFNDTTPRQGVKFYFGSSNIAEGWFEIVGHLRQEA